MTSVLEYVASEYVQPPAETAPEILSVMVEMFSPTVFE
jgi:hypothetical protein